MAERNVGHNEIPFAEPLAESEDSRLLRELKSRPDLVIRPYDLGYFASDYSSRTGEERIKSDFEAAKTIKGLHEELAGYGLNFDAQYVIGKDEKNKDNIYIVSRRIEGDRLYDIDQESLDPAERENLRKEFEKLYSGLLAYLKEKYKTNEPLMADVFHPRQFVYGKIEGEEEKKNKIYLVDLEPIIDCSFRKENGYTRMLESIGRLYDNMQWANRLVGDFPELEAARRKFEMQVWRRNKKWKDKILKQFEGEQEKERAKNNRD